ncbi:hypothetical protein OUZ56_029630 [Daphnia magna]|uniref:Uncharacterized protein n=1 Tax=Daphnia magna TaxID=35525 RepID=A0ABR0B7D5_9CRUS|nr:hypothetical protein OUZ56_029630 [Daphnia magna]
MFLLLTPRHDFSQQQSIIKQSIRLFLFIFSNNVGTVLEAFLSLFSKEIFMVVESYLEFRKRNGVCEMHKSMTRDAVESKIKNWLRHCPRYAFKNNEDGKINGKDELRQDDSDYNC